MEQIENILKQAKQAKGSLAFCKEEIINDTLSALADRVEAATDRILEENAKDLVAMDPSNPKYDRLKLTAERIRTIAAGIRQVAALPSPSGRVLSETVRPNGMKLTKVNVFALCFKSGNACILKGGSDADCSNRILVEIIRNTLLDVAHLSPYLVALLPAGHDSADALLHARGYVDLIIPRGGKGLIDYVRQNATIPVIETGAGVCHVYFDKDGDVAKGAAIIRNAKTRRVSVCNALDCLIVDVNRLTDLFTLCSGLQQDNVEIYADDLCYNYLKTSYPPHLLKHASTDTFGTEFLDYKMAVTSTMTIQSAVAHISIYGSGHSECIVTENDWAAGYFMKAVDAACVYVNVPTSFTDGGEFGLGAEIGISTQKLHARGPMGLEELNTYKWIIQGDGQIRQ